MKKWADLNGQWREVHFMNTPGRLFAALVGQGVVYAIDNYTTKTGKTVKKYDIGNKANNTWTDVRSINVERNLFSCSLRVARQNFWGWVLQLCLQTKGSNRML